MYRYLLLSLLFCPSLVFASAGQEHDPVAPIIFWVTLIFIFAVAGRWLARRFNQPAVLGELLMGILLGNVCYFAGMQLITVLREGSAIFTVMAEMLKGASLTTAVTSAVPDPYYAQQLTTALSSNNGIEYIKVGYILDIFARYGVIFLLFMTGLESSVQELKHTGRESLQVALIGIIAPIAFGYAAASLLMPELPYQAHLFIAATLSATSIGITARVLTEMKKMQTREAKTILGAAVIDDILGLIILAVVSNIVIKGQVDFTVILQVVLSSFLFFTGVVNLGPWVLRMLVRSLSFLQPWEAKLSVSFIFVMGLAWLATVVQLASIIGAFAAGLIIHDGFFDAKETAGKRAVNIRQLVAPLEAILAPLFFMLIGIQVKLETFFDWQVLVVAAGLIIAAIAGKLICGFGGSSKDDRLLIGLGMLPRGEVGLVFASIGRTLGVISNQLFSAIILMIIVTTLIAPPALKMRYGAMTKRGG